jgi:hypothetical protein
MKRVLIIALLALGAVAAYAQSVASTSAGIVVAHDNIIELQGGWSVPGPRNPGAIIVGESRVAVLDPIANEARIIELETGRVTRIETAETPIDGLFIGRDLYVIARDARLLQRFSADGTKTSVETAADPTFLREAAGRIYVYARVGGVLHEVDAARMRITRQTNIAPFATDLELDERNAYLVYARAAKMRVIELASMKPGEEIEVGAVPVDIAFVKGATLTSARTLAVADPSAKRVWLVEGVQSLTQAAMRGFFRGLLGLGVFSGGSSQFPTGVDRVFVRGDNRIAYDSSSGTLYRFTKSRGTPIAKEVGPHAFALTPDGGLVWWNDAVRRLQKLAD